MKIWAWGTVAVSTLALAAAACGGGGSGGSGGSGTGGQTSSVSSSSSSGSHSSSSSTSSSGTGGSSPCGSLVWDSMNADCSTCMTDNCCDQLSACDTGTPCGALFDCIGQCASGDTTCQNNCTTAQMAGLADAQALISCYDTSCKPTAACGTKVCMSGFTVPDQGCGDCLTTNCCDAWTACGADMTCAQCATTNPQPAGCDTNALLKAANDCQTNSCAMQCATGICDSGLGTQSPPCNYCLGQSCCQPIKDCANDPTCKNCLLTGGMATGCSTNALYTTYTTCDKTNCATACGG